MFDYPNTTALAGYIASALSAAAGAAAAATAGDLMLAASARQLGDNNSSTDVIGLSCRYPSADTGAASTSAAAFWSTAADASDLPEVIPASRWDLDSFFSPDTSASGRMYVRFGAFLSGIECFDSQVGANPVILQCSFRPDEAEQDCHLQANCLKPLPQLFNMARSEALGTDPQQRLLLEETGIALADGVAGAGTPWFGSETGENVVRYSYTCAGLPMASVLLQARKSLPWLCLCRRLPGCHVPGVCLGAERLGL